MNVKSYQQFDRPYRRGLVLGLSLAELFLVLLFLLLLVSLGISSALEDKIQVANKKVQNLTDSLAALKTSSGNPITPVELEQLIEKAGEIKNLREEQKKLKDDLKIKDHEIDKLKEENNKYERIAQNLNKNIEQLKADVQTAEERAVATGRAMDAIKKKPGDVPPCWFVEVDSEDGQGLRARHLKIFNVLIKDKTLTVRKHPYPPPLKANFGKKGSLPPVPDDYFMTELTPASFTSAFQAVRDAGENRLIQDYSCRFMVDVYDGTSSDNKEGFKKQLRVVEDLFYKFEEKSNWD